jgi:membrane protein YdbS with pleckstrin-like domain
MTEQTAIQITLGTAFVLSLILFLYSVWDWAYQKGTPWMILFTTVLLTLFIIPKILNRKRGIWS